MKWRILVEAEVDTFADTGEIWDDGFAADGSEWGDDESHSVTAYLQSKKDADSESRCYSAEAQ